MQSNEALFIVHPAWENSVRTLDVVWMDIFRLFKALPTCNCRNILMTAASRFRDIPVTVIVP
jgi:hypothetical protein